MLLIRVISGGNDIQLLVGQMPMGPKGFLGLAKRDAERSKFIRLCHERFRKHFNKFYFLILVYKSILLWCTRVLHIVIVFVSVTELPHENRIKTLSKSKSAFQFYIL